MLCSVVLFLSQPLTWCWRCGEEREREREIHSRICDDQQDKHRAILAIIVRVIVFSEYYVAIYLNKSNRLAETVSERLENGNFDNGVVKEIPFCKQKVS